MSTHIQQDTKNQNPKLWCPEPWIVEDCWSENSETMSMRIKPRDSSVIPEAKPGQFNMLYSFGIGEIPISFSKINQGYWEHTICKVGKVSAALCNVNKGSTIGLRGSFGNHWPLPDDKVKDIYIIAGGLGLAPVRPLIERILKQKEQYRSITLIYGTRDPNHQLFIQDYTRWHKELTFLRTVDCGDSAWEHHVGYIPALIERIHFDPKHSIAYLCGPEIMMRICSESLLQKNLEASQLYLSMERNMKCAIGFCGHCQYGPSFICKDGPIYSYDQIRKLLHIREV